MIAPLATMLLQAEAQPAAAPAAADTSALDFQPAKDLDLSIALAKIRELVEGAIALLPTLVIGLLIFGLFILIARWARGLVRRINEHRNQQTNTALLLGKLTQWLVIVLGILVTLAIILPSFQPGQLITLLGVGGVAIGFAFKDIFQNFLAGVLILVTNPFRVGDQIIVGDYEGTVEQIQTRASFIRTYDGRRVVIPNADLYNDKVTVNTAFRNRRTQYDVGIGYGDDIENAMSLMLEAMRGVEGVLSEPAPDVLTIDLAASWVTVRARWWSNSERADVLRVQDRVLIAIKKTLVSHGIDLPFETRQILFHDQTEATDGDRSKQREGWPAGKGKVPEPARISGALAEMDGAAAGSDGDGND